MNSVNHLPCNFCTSYKYAPKFLPPYFHFGFTLKDLPVILMNKYEIRNIEQNYHRSRVATGCCGEFARIFPRYFFLICLIKKKKERKINCKSIRDISMNLLHSRSYLFAFLFTFPSILDNYLE